MSSSSAAAAFALEALSVAEQLCYVHCDFCDTILAVGVPCSSLFKTVTVRCGHCANLLSVNLRGLLMPAPGNQQLHFGPAAFLPASSHDGLLDDIIPFKQQPLGSFMDRDNVLLNQLQSQYHLSSNGAGMTPPIAPPTTTVAFSTEADQAVNNIGAAPAVNRPAPEKRQRVPSAYNQFIKDEIQRIKAENPDITHREAFSAAAKNWAHFPHIHFGLTREHTGKTKPSAARPQVALDGDGDALFIKEGLHAAAANARAAAPF